MASIHVRDLLDYRVSCIRASKVPDLICVSGSRACSMVRMPFQGQTTVRCLDLGKRSIKRNAQHGVETLMISCSASGLYCCTSRSSALDHATARKAQTLVAGGECVRRRELRFDNATVNTQTLLQHAIMARWSMVSARRPYPPRPDTSSTTSAGCRCCARRVCRYRRHRVAHVSRRSSCSAQCSA